MNARCSAGDHVEVIDARDRLCGAIGTIEFFVGDNVYVSFDELRWSPTRMFFADQLRPALAAPRRRPAVVGTPLRDLPAAMLALLRRVGVSFSKMFF